MIECTVVGRLGKDPELRAVGTGQVCSFNLASNSRRKVDGAWVDTTTWVRVSVWGAQADPCAKYLAKGRQAVAVGELSVSEYVDRSGVSRQSLELRASRVEFVGGAASSAPQQSQDQDPSPESGDDTIPF